MSTLIKTLNAGVGKTARVISSDKNWLEDSAIDQLVQTLQLSGMCVGVGMPDLHPGKGQPIGAAFVTKNCLYPHLIGSDIGCGMGLWQLDVPVKKFKLDKCEKKLVGLDELWQGNTHEWLTERDIYTQDALLLSEHHKLGTIGGGNHFAEFQAVDQVVNSSAFEHSVLDKHCVMLLVHSGSRGLGQKVLRHHIDAVGASAIDTRDHSGACQRYLARHQYAMAWAVANRELIAERFCQRINAVKQPVLDVTHNMVHPLSESDAQLMNLPVDDASSYWLHRKGASPTDKGLVMIPGSRGSLSYLVQPRVHEPEALAVGGFSLAHGAGRKWKRSDARGRLERRFKVKDLEQTALGGRVICKQRDLLYEEAPQAYKDISQVISDLVEANMIDIVATFKPLITYKTRKK